MQVKEEVSTALSEKVKTDPVFNAVAHVWALRERNRHNMTTRGLYYKMRKEGFLYQEKDFEPIFKFISDLGLAKVHSDAKGKVDSIRDFRLPIQAIGQVACGQKPTRVRVANIQAAPGLKPVPTRAIIKEVEPTLAPQASLSITVFINGKPIKVNMPKDITRDELLTILTKFEEVSSSVK